MRRGASVGSAPRPVLESWDSRQRAGRRMACPVTFRRRGGGPERAISPPRRRAEEGGRASVQRRSPLHGLRGRGSVRNREADRTPRSWSAKGVNPKPVRCALYTRVSSRNQMDKDYNSLVTQRERL